MGLIRLRPRPAGSRPAPAPEPDAEVLDRAAGARRRERARPEPVPVVTPTFGAPPPSRPPAAAPSDRVATRVIAFANQKGGVAKTTTTLNLGVAFGEMGHRVLLIDLDPQGNLTMSQGLNPDVIERSMFDVLVHKVPISEIIEKREVDLAVASIDLAGAELALSSAHRPERSLEKALAEVRGSYDFVLVDTPPSLGLLTINAFVAATGVIVPVQCEVPLLRGARAAREHARDGAREPQPARRRRGDRPDDVRRPDAPLREAIEILEESFGDLVFRTRIRKTVRYAEAPVKGSSVLKYDPTGAAAEAYRELARRSLPRRRRRMARKRASMREGPLAGALPRDRGGAAGPRASSRSRGARRPTTSPSPADTAPAGAGAAERGRAVRRARDARSDRARGDRRARLRLRDRTGTRGREGPRGRRRLPPSRRRRSSDPRGRPRAVEPVAEVVEVPTAARHPTELPVVAPVPEPELRASRTRHPRAGSSPPCPTARRGSTSPATSPRTSP